jgi:hypothetical protein
MIAVAVPMPRDHPTSRTSSNAPTITIYSCRVGNALDEIRPLSADN